MPAQRENNLFFLFKDECSFVSLRDVERAMQVMVWFYKHVDALARLMRKVTAEQRTEEDFDVDEDYEEEEVIIKRLKFYASLNGSTTGNFSIVPRTKRK